jgi:hypothetical protein
MIKRTIIGLAAVTSAVALSAKVAGAEPPSAAAQTIRVTANPDGLVAPGIERLRPGSTTFTVTTSDPDSRYVGVVGLKPGASFEVYLDNMRTVLFSQDNAARERAGAQVQRDTALAGGVAVSGRAAQSITLLLRSGGFYLVDYTSLGGPTPAWRPVTVSGNWSNVAHPAPHHLVFHYNQLDGSPRFRAPQRIAPRSRLLITNTTDVLHEAVFIPVRPGTTNDDLTRFFAGQGPSPFAEGGPQGMLPITGGQAVLLSVDLAPGRYVLMSWVGQDPFAGLHHVLDVS